MLALLAVSAATGDDPSFLVFTRRPLPPRSFGVTHTKIGLGPLSSGPKVISEGTILEHSETGRKFLTIWQNSFNDDQSIISMGFIMERTIEIFLASL